MGHVFLQAGLEDREELSEFLAQAGLEDEAARQGYPNYLVARNEQNMIVGTVGFIPCGKSALLRSCVFDRTFPSGQIPLLITRLLEHAGKHRIDTVYLASDKPAAIEFFGVLGFERLADGQLPGEIRHSPHVDKLLQQDNCVFLCKKV